MTFSTVSQVVNAINDAATSHEAGQVYIEARPSFKSDDLFFEIVDAMNARWLADYEGRTTPAVFVITKVIGRRASRATAGRYRSSWVPTVRWTVVLEGIDWHDVNEDRFSGVRHVLAGSYCRRKDAVRAIGQLRKRGADQLTEVLATRVEVA